MSEKQKERKKERKSVRMCVCVCEREREREREKLWKEREKDDIGEPKSETGKEGGEVESVRAASHSQHYFPSPWKK